MKFEIEFTLTDRDLAAVKTVKRKVKVVRLALKNLTLDAESYDSLELILNELVEEMDELLIGLAAGVMADYAEGLQEFIHAEVEV